MDVTRDIGRRKKPEIRRQSHILKLLTRGASLQAILQVLIQDVEEEFPGSTAFILLLDDNKLHRVHAVQAKLPQFYIEAVEGGEFVSGSASCGESDFIKHTVIVDSAAASACWQTYLQLAKEVKTDVLWSEPILSEESELQGVFAVCFAEPTTLSDEVVEMLIDVSNLTGICFHNFKL